jgi:hypothetical protein
VARDLAGTSFALETGASTVSALNHRNLTRCIRTGKLPEMPLPISVGEPKGPLRGSDSAQTGTFIFQRRTQFAKRRPKSGIGPAQDPRKPREICKKQELSRSESRQFRQGFSSDGGITIPDFDLPLGEPET